jgi:hypothetical protein
VRYKFYLCVRICSSPSPLLPVRLFLSPPATPPSFNSSPLETPSRTTTGNVLTSVTRSLPVSIQVLQALLLRLILMSPSSGARATLHCCLSEDAYAASRRSLGYFDSACVPGSINKAAADPKLRHWLWKHSAERTALPKVLDLHSADV